MSIRTRFLALFVALVIAPVVLLFVASAIESSRLADQSIGEYEHSLRLDAEHDVRTSLLELSRLEDRTFGGIQKRCRALATHAEQLFRERKICEASGRWNPARISKGGYGWKNAATEPDSIWLPDVAMDDAVRSDLAVLANFEVDLLAEPRSEGMTQWYIITDTGISVLVPNSAVVPEPGFDPRRLPFYLPATPKLNPEGRSLWTAAYNDPAGRGAMISCVTPVGRGAEFHGVIGFDVNTAAFHDEIRSVGNDWLYAFIIDAGGNILLVTPEGSGHLGVSFPTGTEFEPLDWRVAGIPSTPLRLATAQMSNAVEGLARIQIDGKDRIVAHRRLQSMPWTLAVVADPDRFLQPIDDMKAAQRRLQHRFIFTIAASGVILLGSCVVFALFLTQTVTRPLRSLAEASREIGRGAPETRLGDAGPDEIGTLTETLRQMVRDREAAQKLVAEAQKLSALGGMASGICHELNNLLSPILGFAQVLKKEGATAGQRASAERIEQAALSARAVVGSLLDSTRDTAGRRVAADLNAVAKEALAQLETPCRAAGVRVEWDLEPALPKTLANTGLLQRVFYNIADNAIQAMAGKGPGGRLRIESRAAGGTIRLAFDDDGPGIAPENLTKVFDPFFTTKPPGAGTGLGLSVATSCVRAHGGTIAASNRPGGGARFSVELPVVSAEESPRPPEAALPAPARRARVLAVDDEDSIRVLVSHTLSADYDVTTCDSGRAALDALAKDTFDVVLCDLRLRDISGRDVFAWIREHRPALASRFLVVTGDTHGDRTRAFLDEFQTPCLTKPFDLDDLCARVRDTLGAPTLP